MPDRVALTSPKSKTGQETRQKGCLSELCWGQLWKEGMRGPLCDLTDTGKEEPSHGATGPEMIFTTKSLGSPSLSEGLLVEEPCRRKLRLNVLMGVTEDASIFSAKKETNNEN